jgi:hypothetical protein
MLCVALAKTMPKRGEFMKSDLMEIGSNWKTRTLLMGAVVGLLVGVAAAYLMVQRAEDEHTTPQLQAKEGIKLGVLLFGLLREVAALGDRN